MTQTQFQIPDQIILDLATAEFAPVFKMNSYGNYAILLHRKMYKDLADLVEPEIKLAGVRTNPKTNISNREPFYYSVTIFDIQAGQEFEIEGLPKEGKFCKLVWNKKQDQICIYNVTSYGVEAWVIDVINKKVKFKTDCDINANLGQSALWLDDNSILVECTTHLFDDIKSKSTHLPEGPAISENDGHAVESRTFQDLLKDEIDSFNFELITTSQIWKYDADGIKSLWKDKAMHDGISLSPDGRYLLLSEIKKPFSYFVPFDRFKYSTHIYDNNGNYLSTMVESPLLEYIPQGFMAVQDGMRNIKWRSDQDSTLIWVEAQDGGDPSIDVEIRDILFQRKFPSEKQPTELFRFKDRFAGVYFSNKEWFLLYEQWWANRNLKMVLANENNEQIVINERNYQDIYNDPGSVIMQLNAYGKSVCFLDHEDNIYLSGEGHHENGRSPFIDKLNLKTNHKERIFQADCSLQQEDIVSIIDIEKGNVLSIIQSKTKYPNFFIRNIFNHSLRQLRHFENPFKAIENITKEVITYQREDGVELNGTLYLPENYNKQNPSKLPLLMWAYPTEYKSKETAAQKAFSDHEYVYPFWGSPLYWVAKGYAILDNASFPILGEGDDQPNETFVPQLVSNAKAAINYLDNLGYIDSKKVAIGGHSYGAFMVSMLLTNSDLFAAGIARSGAYNRTLTPFGFQSEERNYWQAKEVYNAMNPFIDADKMKTPLLLIHGEADNNSGTYTMQTERYYAALKANGAKVRMVLLPYESHSYAAKENILHVLWEQDQWLEKWVK